MKLLIGIALGVAGSWYAREVWLAHKGQKVLDGFYDRLAGSLPEDQVFRP